MCAKQAAVITGHIGGDLSAERIHDSSCVNRSKRACSSNSGLSAARQGVRPKCAQPGIRIQELLQQRLKFGVLAGCIRSLHHRLYLFDCFANQSLNPLSVNDGKARTSRTNFAPVNRSLPFVGVVSISRNRIPMRPDSSLKNAGDEAQDEIFAEHLIFGHTLRPCDNETRQPYFDRA